MSVFWHDATVGREARWSAAGLTGATVWFTGLSGSGKSTIAFTSSTPWSSGGRSTCSTATTSATA